MNSDYRSLVSKEYRTNRNTVEFDHFARRNSTDETSEYYLSFVEIDIVDDCSVPHSFKISNFNILDGSSLEDFVAHELIVALIKII